MSSQAPLLKGPYLPPGPPPPGPPIKTFITAPSFTENFVEPTTPSHPATAPTSLTVAPDAAAASAFGVPTTPASPEQYNLYASPRAPYVITRPAARRDSGGDGVAELSGAELALSSEETREDAADQESRMWTGKESRPYTGGPAFSGGSYVGGGYAKGHTRWRLGNTAPLEVW